jgi:hypothetical protein
MSEPMVTSGHVIWESTRCSTCFAPAGLACSDDNGYRQPGKSHVARVKDFDPWCTWDQGEVCRACRLQCFHLNPEAK